MGSKQKVATRQSLNESIGARGNKRNNSYTNERGKCQNAMQTD